MHLTVRFEAPVGAPAELAKVVVNVHYEMYVGAPVLVKWVEVFNGNSSASRALGTGHRRPGGDDNRDTGHRRPSAAALRAETSTGCNGTTRSLDLSKIQLHIEAVLPT